MQEQPELDTHPPQPPGVLVPVARARDLRFADRTVGTALRDLCTPPGSRSSAACAA